MILEALRNFDDIHTHVKAGPKSICSLPPKEAMALSRSDIDQPYSIMLHPWYTNQQMIDDFVEAVEICASDPRFVAIGECGFDANCQTPFPMQEKSLTIALQSARKHQKPVILHVVKSWDALFAAVDLTFGLSGAISADAEGCRMIVHGFRKNEVFAQQLIRLGYYISLGCKYNPKVLSTIDKDRVYFETDNSAM